jgi:rhomboid protease GluP
MVSTGEWYRLFTAPMLHLDLAHLLLNSLAFLMIGILLERLVGRAWFLACFMTGALGGSALSLALNPASTTSVGASGAIMGLFAAAFVSSYRVPLGTLTRQRIQSRSIQVLIPSLIPLYTTSATGHIDYAAHIGGALSGAAAGFFLLRAWPDTNPLPRFRNLAAGVAATGMLLILGSGAGVVSHYSRYEALAYLIPQGQVPKTADLTLAGSADLVTRYPRDPRAHLLRGTALIQVRDNTDAEAELRTALSEAEALTFFFGDAVADGARTALAVVLQEEGRAQEAKETARPLCLARGDARSEKLRKLLFDERLCD